MSHAMSPRARRLDIEAAAVALATAALTVLYSLRSGTYDMVVRGELALLIWIALGLGWATGILPRAKPSRFLWPAVVGFLALAIWTTISLKWTESDERTVIELGRVAHHAGVFLLAASVLTRRTWRAALGGLTAGLIVVSWIGLSNWLWPGSIATDFVRSVFGVNRLSYPLAYFNGMGTLGVMTALAALGWATHAPAWWQRALAIIPVPGVIVMTYLTYSRGSVLEMGVGIVVLLAVSRHRIPTLIVGLITAAGATLTILTLRNHQQIVEGVGSTGAGAVLGLAVASGFVAGAAALALTLAGSDERLRLPHRVGVPVMAVLGVVVLAAIAVVSPAVVRKAGESLNAEPVNNAANPTARFTSLGGSRLIQFRAAVDSWRDHPMEGTGPGTFEFTWNRDPRYNAFVRDVHDLYLEALAESGVPGLIALVLALAGLAAVALLAMRASPDGPNRGAAAIAITMLAVFLAAAVVDWAWELTALPFIALLATGAAASSLGGGAYRRALRPSRIFIPIAALLALVAVLPAVVSRSEVRASQESARKNDSVGALRQADDAINAAPWSATAMAQKSLLLEDAGMLRQAEGYARLAIEREPTNWRYPLLRARLRAAQGDVAGAVRLFRKARRLAPRNGALQ